MLHEGVVMYQDNRWKVYRLTNHTLQEIYVGIARDCMKRCNQHAGISAGGAKTIAHWDWAYDDIAAYTYPERFNSQKVASEFAHGTERFCRIPDGYDIFLTAGW